MAILKKVDAVKEALITEVSNDADMSSRRLIEATLQLDGYIFCKRKNIFYKISLSAIVKKLNELFLTKVLFQPPNLFLKPCKFSHLVCKYLLICKYLLDYCLP